MRHFTVWVLNVEVFFQLKISYIFQFYRSIDVNEHGKDKYTKPGVLIHDLLFPMEKWQCSSISFHKLIEKNTVIGHAWHRKKSVQRYHFHVIPDICYVIRILFNCRKFEVSTALLICLNENETFICPLYPCSQNKIE